MKKLMIAAAIVCVAAFAQAASCTWAVAKVYAPTATSLAPAVAETTLLSSGTATLYYALSLDGADTEWNVMKSGTISSGATAKEELFIATTIPSDIAENDNKAYFKVIVNTTIDGKDYELEIYPGTATAPVEQSFATLGKTGVNMAFSGMADKTTSKAWTTSAVPEPTSGLLLLLGVAGLALRRRRA